MKICLSIHRTEKGKRAGPGLIRLLLIIGCIQMLDEMLVEGKPFLRLRIVGHQFHGLRFGGGSSVEMRAIFDHITKLFDGLLAPFDASTSMSWLMQMHKMRLFCMQLAIETRRKQLLSISVLFNIDLIRTTNRLLIGRII